jgi:hypothetical protein
VPRKSKPIDPAKIKELAADGCPDGDISLIVGCSAVRLRRYRRDIDVQRAIRRAKFRKWQTDMARTSIGMLVWLGKQELGQSEIGSKTDGAPVLPLMDPKMG